MTKAEAIIEICRIDERSLRKGLWNKGDGDRIRRAAIVLGLSEAERQELAFRMGITPIA